MNATKSLRARFEVHDRRAAWSIAGDWAIIIGAQLLAMHRHSIVWSVVAIVVIGARQTALLNLVHTAAHRALFKRAELAFLVDWIVAAPIFESVATYRDNHLDHHDEIARRAPDRFAYLHGELRLHQRDWLGRTWIIFIRPLLGYQIVSFLSVCAATIRRSRLFAIRMLIFWTVAIGVATALGGAKLLFLYWLVPLLTVHPILNLWAEVSDHFNVEGELESRNQRGLFFGLFLKGHDLYHELHHRYPSVPYYHLAALYEETRASDVVGETVSGPFAFLRCIYRQRKDCDAT